MKERFSKKRDISVFSLVIWFFSFRFIRPQGLKASSPLGVLGLNAVEREIVKSKSVAFLYRNKFAVMFRKD